MVSLRDLREILTNQTGNITKLTFILLVLYIIIWSLLFKFDPSGEGKIGGAVGVTVFTLGLGVFFLLFMMIYNNDLLFGMPELTLQNLWSVGKISGVVLLGVLGFFALNTLFFHFLGNPPASRDFFRVTNILIFSTTLLFILYQVKEYRFENKYLQLLRNSILYIPCLIFNLIDWIKYQYSITTPTALIILGIDVALIVMKFMVWPKIALFLKHYQSQGTVLLEGPLFLNTKTDLGTYENMKVVKENRNFKYHYGISFWVYINPQPPNTSAAYNEYSILFDYGGKPTLLYKADENKLKIQMKMNDEYTKNIYLGSDLKLQKWNHFVINYDGGTLDILLNDVLLSSTGSIAPYMTLDIVSVGQNNGINGGIRDVVYFRNPIV